MRTKTDPDVNEGFIGFYSCVLLVSQFICVFYGCVFAADGQRKFVPVLASPVS